MLKYIIRRILYMIPATFIVSVIVFFIIQLPPGDYLSIYAAKAVKEGETIDKRALERLRAEYGLDKPWYVQYIKWIGGIITKGDFGHSFTYKCSVVSVIKQRIGITITVSLITMLFTYLVALPIGIYSAVKQYSIGDYIVTVIGFLGLAAPNFLFAIILMYLSFKYFGNPLIGLISHEYIESAWTWTKFFDLLKHLVIPIIVIGTAGTCGLIRVLRGQLLDELNKQYVVTARSKGLSEKYLLFKYPVRAALNPIASTIGWSLTSIFTGSTITAIVLNLPTMGPVMYKALLNQDMYLAGSWLLLMTVLTFVGTLISDILLAWLDPRIRYESKGK